MKLPGILLIARQHQVAEFVLGQFHFPNPGFNLCHARAPVVRRREREREAKAQPVVVRFYSGEHFQ